MSISKQAEEIINEYSRALGGITTWNSFAGKRLPIKENVRQALQEVVNSCEYSQSIIDEYENEYAHSPYAQDNIKEERPILAAKMEAKCYLEKLLQE